MVLKMGRILGFFLLVFGLTVVSASSIYAQGLSCPTPLLGIPLAAGQIDFLSVGGRWDCNGPTNFFNNALGPNQPRAVCDNLSQGLPQPFIGDYKYNQLSGGSNRTYTPQSEFTRDGEEPVPFFCDIKLECTQSCIPPDSSIGNCDGGCEFTVPPSGSSCPQYGGAMTYVATIAAPGNGVFIWDDGTPNTLTTDGSPTAHSYLNAGMYDIQLNCNSGGQLCIKRVNVVCQPDGGGGPTPTPLPTATPTPTGGPNQCAEGLRCMHPCACNTSSNAYIIGCPDGSGGAIGQSSDQTLAQADGEEGVLGAQIAQAVGGSEIADGGSCGPGLVCCTPASLPGSPWYKVKDTDFHKLGNLIDPVPIPPAASSYDNKKIDNGLCEIGQTHITCMNINNPGVISAKGFIDIGTAPLSYRGWGMPEPNYNLNRLLTPSIFLDYVRARKEYIEINDLNDIQPDIVNIFVGSTVFDNNGIGNDDFLLIVDGDLDINQTQAFNPSNKSVGFIVTGTLRIQSQTNKISGVFIAHDIDFASDIPRGSTTNVPLWVNGNLISFTERECTEKRQRTDDPNKPSCFFSMNFKGQYIPLLDLLSTRSYKRTEIIN